MQAFKGILAVILLSFFVPVYAQSLESRMLLQALMNNRFDKVREYLSVIPSAELKSQKTAFVAAAARGSPENLGLLAEYGLVADKADFQTLLLYGAESGSLSLMDLSLQSGANIDGQDAFGRTALMMACAGARLDAVSYLLLMKADPAVSDKSGYTAASYFLYSHAGKTAPAALSAPLSAQDSFAFFLYDDSYRQLYGASLMQSQNQDARSRGVFHFFAYGNGTIKEAGLFDQYFPAPKEGSSGAGELYLAMKVKEKRNKAIAKMILGKDRYGVTPAWLCVRTGNAELLKEILAWGENPDSLGPSGATLAEEAVVQNQPECILILLIAGADLDRMVKNKKITLRQYLIETGHQDLLQ
jgi:ankyrin repeat protein